MSRRPGLLRPLMGFGAAAALGAITRGEPRAVEERLRRGVVRYRRPDLDRAVPVLTDLGSMYAAAGIAAGLWLHGRRRLAVDVVGSATAAWVVAQGAKRMFGRPRPYRAGAVEMLVREPKGTSYPSGHPAVARAMAEVLTPHALLPARKILDAGPRFVAFSRVYVGVHYPSDVVGGLLIGRAVGSLWRRARVRRTGKVRDRYGATGD